MSVSNPDVNSSNNNIYIPPTPVITGAGFDILMQSWLQNKAQKYVIDNSQITYGGNTYKTTSNPVGTSGTNDPKFNFNMSSPDNAGGGNIILIALIAILGLIIAIK